jgi:rhodanese-related sulfurtransferase
MAGLALGCLAAVVLIGRDVYERTQDALSWQDVFLKIEGTWPDVSQMVARDLARLLARSDERSRPFLIDVRQRDEYELSHLPGAVQAESSDDIRALVSGLPAGRDVVLYCSVGIRSSAAAERLMRDGRTNVFNLQGSIFQWANDGYPVVSNGGPTHVVHPYDSEWGVLLEASHHPGSLE